MRDTTFFKEFDDKGNHYTHNNFNNKNEEAPKMAKTKYVIQYVGLREGVIFEKTCDSVLEVAQWCQSNPFADIRNIKEATQ